MDSPGPNSRPAETAATPAPTSNVQIVNAQHLALDAKKNHRSRRALIIFLLVLGLIFAAIFGFLGWKYYTVVYAPPKLFTTECFELSMPAGSSQIAEESTPDAAPPKCALSVAAPRRAAMTGTVSGNQDKLAVSSKDYLDKVGKINAQMLTQAGFEIVSQEQATLGGQPASLYVTSKKSGGETETRYNYFGLHDGRYFMIGWSYSSNYPAGKQDVEKSAASFRWK